MPGQGNSVTCGNCAKASKYGRVNDGLGVSALRIARAVTGLPLILRSSRSRSCTARRKEREMWVNDSAGRSVRRKPLINISLFLSLSLVESAKHKATIGRFGKTGESFKPFLLLANFNAIILIVRNPRISDRYLPLTIINHLTCLDF